MKTQYILFFLSILLISSCASVQGGVRDEIRIGMNKEEVRLILGEPDKIYNSDNCPNCKSNEEDWIYKGVLFNIVSGKKTIVFIDGIVVDIHEGHWTDK